VAMFLEKLKHAGRFDGFFDPSIDDVGMLWLELVCDEKGAPLTTSFYVRKGGARKITESKRRAVEEQMRGVDGVSSVSVEYIHNQMATTSRRQ